MQLNEAPLADEHVDRLEPPRGYERAKEVSLDDALKLLAEHRENARFFAAGAKPGKHMFDLPGYIVARLARMGIAAEWIGRDTCAERDVYFSYRRTTLAGGGDYGRNVSAIVLER